MAELTVEDTIGHPETEGVVPGDRFDSRAHLSAAAVHLPRVSGVSMLLRHDPELAAEVSQLEPESFAVATSLVVGAGSARAARAGLPVVEYRVPCDTDEGLDIASAAVAVALALRSPVRVVVANPPDLSGARQRRTFTYRGLFQVIECRIDPPPGATDDDNGDGLDTWLSLPHKRIFTLLGIPGQTAHEPPARNRAGVPSNHQVSGSRSENNGAPQSAAGGRSASGTNGLPASVKRVRGPQGAAAAGRSARAPATTGSLKPSACPADGARDREHDARTGARGNCDPVFECHDASVRYGLPQPCAARDGSAPAPSAAHTAATVTGNTPEHAPGLGPRPYKRPRTACGSTERNETLRQMAADSADTQHGRHTPGTCLQHMHAGVSISPIEAAHTGGVHVLPTAEAHQSADARLEPEVLVPAAAVGCAYHSASTARQPRRRDVQVNAATGTGVRGLEPSAAPETPGPVESEHMQPMHQETHAYASCSDHDGSRGCSHPPQDYLSVATQAEQSPTAIPAEQSPLAAPVSPNQDATLVRPTPPEPQHHTQPPAVLSSVPALRSHEPEDAAALRGASRAAVAGTHPAVRTGAVRPATAAAHLATHASSPDMGTATHTARPAAGAAAAASDPTRLSIAAVARLSDPARPGTGATVHLSDPERPGTAAATTSPASQRQAKDAAVPAPAPARPATGATVRLSDPARPATAAATPAPVSQRQAKDAAVPPPAAACPATGATVRLSDPARPATAAAVPAPVPPRPATGVAVPSSDPACQANGAVRPGTGVEADAKERQTLLQASDVSSDRCTICNNNAATTVVVEKQSSIQCCAMCKELARGISGEGAVQSLRYAFKVCLVVPEIYQRGFVGKLLRCARRHQKSNFPQEGGSRSAGASGRPARRHSQSRPKERTPNVLLRPSRVPPGLNGEPHLYCADISAGAELLPVAAVIDDPDGLRASGVGPPPIFPSGFIYCNFLAALPMTQGARRFLDAVYPSGEVADMWDGCKGTRGERPSDADSISRSSDEPDNTEAMLQSFKREGSVRLDRDGRLELTCNHTPLMECEPDCGCSLPSVTGRSKLTPPQLQIFLHQTEAGAPSPVGWGVRCTKPIRAGTFIRCYTGVVALHSETSGENEYVTALNHYIHAGARIKSHPDDLEQGDLQRLPRLDHGKIPKFVHGLPDWTRRYASEDGDLFNNGPPEQLQTWVFRGSFNGRPCSRGFDIDRSRSATLRLRPLPPRVPPSTEGTSSEEQPDPEAGRVHNVKAPRVHRAVPHPGHAPPRKPWRARAPACPPGTKPDPWCRWKPYGSLSALPGSDEVPEDADYLVIDGEHAGSVARFFNHSCAKPNMVAQNVFGPGTGSPLLYTIALFAEKDIPAMTELRWNYYGTTPTCEAEEGRVRCSCGSTPCRKWLC